MEASYFNPLEIFFALAHSLMPLIIFVASAYYLSKKTELESILLSIGSFLTLGTSILFNVLSRSVDSDFYSSLNFSVIQGLSYLGSLLFAVGFVMIIIKIVKKELDF